MALNLVIGRAGSGKTRCCLEQIKAKYRQPGSNPLIYIVPEQFNLEAERQLLGDGSIGALFRVEVLTFKRMAHRAFSEAAPQSLQYINGAGKKICLAAIVEGMGDQLRHFARQASSEGFIDNLAGMIAELKRLALTPDALLAAADPPAARQRRTDPRRAAARAHPAPAGTFMLSQKIGELAEIYRRYNDWIESAYLDADDDLTRLARLLPESGFMRGADIWIDGFSGFTAQEKNVVAALAKAAAGVTVCLCCDSAPADAASVSDLDLFAPAKRTAAELAELAEQSGSRATVLALRGGGGASAANGTPARGGAGATNEALTPDGAGATGVEGGAGVAGGAGATEAAPSSGGANIAGGAAVARGERTDGGAHTAVGASGASATDSAEGARAGGETRAAGEPGVEGGAGVAGGAGATEAAPPGGGTNIAGGAGEPRPAQDSDALGYLERNIYRYDAAPYPHETDAVSIVKCGDAFDEVEFAAADILKSCRERRCRFSDIAIICADLETYAPMIKPIFSQYGINCFIDMKTDIAAHPLIRMLTALFAIGDGNFSYESVFSYLKSGYTDVPAEDVDLLENFVLAHGIHGNMWLSDAIWDAAAAEEYAGDGASHGVGERAGDGNGVGEGAGGGKTGDDSGSAGEQAAGGGAAGAAAGEPESGDGARSGAGDGDGAGEYAGGGASHGVGERAGDGNGVGKGAGGNKAGDDSGNTGERAGGGAGLGSVAGAAAWARLDAARRNFLAPVAKFFGALRADCSPASFCASLYAFLNDCGAHRKIIEKLDQHAAAGAGRDGRDTRDNSDSRDAARDRLAASELKQIWGFVMDVLDQIYALGETRPPSQRSPGAAPPRERALASLARMFLSGLGAYRVGVIPPSADEVLIGNAERTRSHPVKLLYILGARDGLFPQIEKQPALLTDADRVALRARGLDIGRDSVSCSFDAQFGVYSVLTIPLEQLKLTWPASGAGGKATKPASAVQMLRRLFPRHRAIEFAPGQDAGGRYGFELQTVSMRHAFDGLVREIRAALDARRPAGPPPQLALSGPQSLADSDGAYSEAMGGNSTDSASMGNGGAQGHAGSGAPSGGANGDGMDGNIIGINSTNGGNIGGDINAKGGNADRAAAGDSHMGNGNMDSGANGDGVDANSTDGASMGNGAMGSDGIGGASGQQPGAWHESELAESAPAESGPAGDGRARASA
ncbi:MAG: exodeoxyribonuclease V subunit gamma, partial [Clostridiales bacterium]|nr:exodeoxyribonuclease V subunit gamma [Clostridiales bacterium]